MKINVTQRHIDAGNQHDSSHCAIALAIREQVGMPVMVAKTVRWAAQRYIRNGNAYSSIFDAVPPSMDNTEVGLVKLGDSTGYRDIGEEAAKFIDAFDESKTLVEPFSFELDYELEAVESPIKIYPSPVQIEARETVQTLKTSTLKNYESTSNQRTN